MDCKQHFVVTVFTILSYYRMWENFGVGKIGEFGK